MKRYLYPLFTLALFAGWDTPVTSAHALECANIGAAWTTQPNDLGDGLATACGNGSVAGGDTSLALGYEAFSTGNESTALGYRASSGGHGSTAMGRSAASGGVGSLAQGYGATSGGDYSLALGAFVSSPGSVSTALGHSSLSNGNASTAVGAYASAPNPNTIVLGEIPGVNAGINYTAVANGTTAPLAPLHIFRDDGTAQVLVEETSTDPLPRTLFRLASAGSNAKFEIDNTMAGVNWAFTNSGSDFRISRQGSGVIEFRVDNAGNAFVHNDLEVGGNLTTNLNMPSDRNLKQKVEAVNPETILAKVAALPVMAWEYTDRPGERHIGPMAQAFHAAFELGEDDTTISVVDASGVALASIQALNEKLETQNQQLRDEVEELRTLVMQLLPQVAQN